MSYYYDSVCNKILTGKSGQHAKLHHMNSLNELCNNEIAIELGTAYWKFGRRDPDAVKKLILKFEQVSKRKITDEEKEFLNK